MKLERRVLDEVTLAEPAAEGARVVAPVGEGGAEALLAIEHPSGTGEAGLGQERGEHAIVGGNPSVGAPDVAAVREGIRQSLACSRADTGMAARSSS